MHNGLNYSLYATLYAFFERGMVGAWFPLALLDDLITVGYIKLNDDWRSSAASMPAAIIRGSITVAGENALRGTSISDLAYDQEFVPIRYSTLVPRDILRSMRLACTELDAEVRCTQLIHKYHTTVAYHVVITEHDPHPVSFISNIWAHLITSNGGIVALDYFDKVRSAPSYPILKKLFPTNESVISIMECVE